MMNEKTNMFLLLFSIHRSAFHVHHSFLFIIPRSSFIVVFSIPARGR